MIKSNKPQQASILRSGYRNQLKKHSEHSQSNKESRTNHQDLQDGARSTIEKLQRQSRPINDTQSRSSQRSRGTSIQRALNSSYGNPSLPNQQPKQSIYQVQSQVRENYPFYQQKQQSKRKGIQRNPSEPVAQSNISQSGSDVNTQIETLNRLREEHQIIRQVTSDDELVRNENEIDGTQVGKSHQNEQRNGDFSRRNYIYESRQSVPVQIIRNKTLNSRIAWDVNQPKPSRNPQREDDHYSESSQKAQKSKQPVDSLPNSSLPPQPTINHQYLLQITSLQAALTQSSLKIQQLLTESIQTKQKLRQYQQTTEKAYRLQSELKMMKESEKYLKKEIQMKDEEIQRYEKRMRLMKQTVEMVEKEGQMKDREISALQGLIRRNNTILGEEKSREIEQTYQELEKMKKSTQKISKDIEDGSSKRQQRDAQSIKEVNNDLKDKLDKAQSKVYELQSSNLKLTLQLESQKQKNTHLEQTISSRISSSSHQNQPFQQTAMSKQIQNIRQQLSKLKGSSQQQMIGTSYVTELERKLRQLEEVVKNENEEKQKFILEISRIRDEQKINGEKVKKYFDEIAKVKQENLDLVRENSAVKRQLTELKEQNTHLIRIQSEISTKYVPKQQYNQLERQKQNLSQQVTNLQNQQASLSANYHQTTLQDQILVKNLNEIKSQYMKLQEAYFQKANQYQTQKLELQRLSFEIKALESEIQHFQNALEAQKNYSTQLQQKIQEKQFKLLEFLNLAENTSTFNEKISELHREKSSLEIKLRQKESQIAKIQLEHKKILGQEKQIQNQLQLQLSQKNIEILEIKNSFQEQMKIHSQQNQNYKKELEMAKQELQEQQRHYKSVQKSDQEMMSQQIHLLQSQLFTIMKEKEKLMEETMKMSHLEHELKALIMKDKNNRKLSESIDHLWMIKEAEYFNVNKILELTRDDNYRDEKSQKTSSNIRIDE